MALTTLAIIGGVVGVASSIIGGVSAGVAADQQSANAESQAKLLEYNRKVEENEARRVEAETVENARRQREQADYLKASQRALLGKSGAALSSGSPLAVLGATAADEERKIQDIHRQGYYAAQQHTEQAKSYQYQSGVARASSSSSLARGLSVVSEGINGLNSGLSLANNAFSLGKNIKISGK